MPRALAGLPSSWAVSGRAGAALGGRWREAHWGFHLMSIVLLLRYVFLKH